MNKSAVSSFVILLGIMSGNPIGSLGTPIEEAEAGSATREPILLRNIHLFDAAAGAMSEAQDLLIVDGNIAALEDDLDPPSDAETIDCAGRYAIPGLFDSHTHLSHLVNAQGDSLRSALEGFVLRGITHVRDVGGPADVLSSLEEQIASGEMLGPEIFYSGPMLEHSPLTWGRFNENLPGFTVAIDSMADVDSILPALASQGACMIKTFNKQDSAVCRYMLEEARRLSLRVVHDPGGPLFHALPMDVALDLGVMSIEHAKAPWPVVLRDDLRREHDSLLVVGPGEMGKMGFAIKAAGLGVESISEDRLRGLAEKMKEKRAYLCPTLFVLEGAEEMAIEESRKQMGADSLSAPALQMIRTMVGGMVAISQHIVRQFAAYEVKMLVGQDGGDPAATFTEMRLMKEAGVPEAEILRGATLYPAQWLGVDDRWGAIAPGRPADLLVVDANPLEDITRMEATFLVVHQGRILRPRVEP